MEGQRGRERKGKGEGDRGTGGKGTRRIGRGNPDTCFIRNPDFMHSCQDFVIGHGLESLPTKDDSNFPSLLGRCTWLTDQEMLWAVKV